MARTHELNDPQKIMVRATNWVGDGVISLAALDALRYRFPNAEIVLVAKPWVTEMYWHHPAVNRQIVYDPDGEHRGFRGFRKLIETIRAEQFDAAILFQNAFQAAWMAWRAGIPVRLGYARDGRSMLLTDAILVPPRAAYGHQAYYYLQMLFRAGVIEKPELPHPITAPMLLLQDAEKKWAVNHLRSLGLEGPRFLVGLNPGAFFGPAKRWPPEQFAALADRLIGALHADVLIFGSPAERPLAETIARAMKHTPTIVAGDTTLRQFMTLLAQCRLVVTNDSGPMHLAAALGLPLVAIFGSTDERSTGPLSSRARVVRHAVPCSPCGLRECPIDFRCMLGVTVDNVHRVALELVKELDIRYDRSR
ncbi:MAG: lipopolysaccharide heptosyltransferase II [Terriglobia bacterium]